MLYLHDKIEFLMIIASIIMTMNLGIFIFYNTARSVLETSDIKIVNYKAIIFFICPFVIFKMSSMLNENLFFAYLFTTSIGSMLFIRVY